MNLGKPMADKYNVMNVKNHTTRKLMKIEKRYVNLLIFLTIFLSLYSCAEKDESPEQPATNSDLIDSLVSTKDTLTAWIDTTAITVYTHITPESIHWSADHGTITGSGSTITYFGGQCCTGTNTITCRVTSDTYIEEKTIRIHVKSYY